MVSEKTVNGLDGRRITHINQRENLKWRLEFLRALGILVFQISLCSWPAALKLGSITYLFLLMGFILLVDEINLC